MGNNMTEQKTKGCNFISRRYLVAGIENKNINIEFITKEDGSILVIENGRICLDEMETDFPFSHLRRLKL